MPASLQIDELTKVYGRDASPAVDSLSLSVTPGEVYGFLGANGAGKSTTIRLLLNFIQPTHGTATICGQDVVKNSVSAKKHVGYLAGDVALWPKVTGNEIFAYLNKLQQKDSSEYLQTLIKQFEAEPDKPIHSLSKGNRQKIGVIQALMHQPDVLILDEPTSGLDPLMQEVFYSCIDAAKSRGAAVFVSSHNLAEAQRMCDRIGVIKHGKLIREQSLHGDSLLGAPVFRVVLHDAKDAGLLSKSSTIKVLSKRQKTLVIQPTADIAATLKVLSVFKVDGLTTEQLNLEDEFMEFYGDGA